MPSLLKKNFNSADRTIHQSDRLTADLIEVRGKKLYRVTAQPGWKWSIDIKPIAKTDSCQVDHLIYMISGNMVVRMDNGDEQEYGPGDIAAIPPGHDGWGKDKEPTIWLEIPH